MGPESKWSGSHSPQACAGGEEGPTQPHWPCCVPCPSTQWAQYCLGSVGHWSQARPLLSPRPRSQMPDSRVASHSHHRLFLGISAAPVSFVCQRCLFLSLAQNLPLGGWGSCRPLTFGPSQVTVPQICSLFPSPGTWATWDHLWAPQTLNPIFSSPNPSVAPALRPAPPENGPEWLDGAPQPALPRRSLRVQ